MRLIDADELAEKMKSRMWMVGRASDAVCLIEDAPTLETTHAIKAEWEFDRPHHYACSNCGLMWGDSALMMRFCPKCGAEMSERYTVIWQDGKRKEFIRKDKKNDNQSK